MINSLTLLSLLKPTMIFVFNLRRMVRLLTMPALVLLAVSFVVFFYPPFFLAQEVDLKIEVNFYSLLLIAFSLMFVFVSVASHVQRVLFFEDEKNKKDAVLWMKPDKKFFRCLLVCFKIALFSLVLSGLVCFVLAAIVQSFIPLPKNAGMYFIFGTLLLCPYFAIRFILLLPAEVADRSLGWMVAWRMTARLNITMGLLLVLFLLLALMFSSSFYSMLRNIFETTPLVSFIGNYVTVISVLIASVMQAAYVGYLFSLLDSKR